MNVAALLLGLSLLASDPDGGSREGDASLFIELFRHLEPHALTGVWWGGDELGFGTVSPFPADAAGAPLHGSPEHPEGFADRAGFLAHYRAALGGGNGFLIYNITVVMWIAAALVLLVFARMAKAARRLQGEAPKGTGYGVLESMVLFVRDDMVYAVMGKEHGRRFLPLFLTMGFFILAMNLLSLLPLGPVGGTATANLAVNAGLALVTVFWIHMSGIRDHGFFKHWKNFIPHGLPWFAVPIVAIVELLGMIVKPAALVIRLFANMTAGHLIVLALFGLVYFFNSWVIAPFPMAMAIFIYVLEIVVAIIQAYIFTYLSILFVGWAVHPEH